MRGRVAAVCVQNADNICMSGAGVRAGLSWSEPSVIYRTRFNHNANCVSARDSSYQLSLISIQLRLGESAVRSVRDASSTSEEARISKHETGLTHAMAQHVIRPIKDT